MLEYLVGVFAFVVEYCSAFSEYVLWAMAISTIGFIIYLIRRFVGKKVRPW